MKTYAKIDGMLMVPMKAKPGRPALAKKQVRVTTRLDDECRRGLTAFAKKRKDLNDSDRLRYLIKQGLIVEGIITPAASVSQ